MRIDCLTVKNFRGFADRTWEFPRAIDAPADVGSFHVFIGENGTGKTSVLEALAVSLGVWNQALQMGHDQRKVRLEDVRLIEHRSGDTFRFDPAPLLCVTVDGQIAGHNARWGRTSTGYGDDLRTDLDLWSYSEKITDRIREFTIGTEPPQVLPVITQFGTGRASLDVNSQLPVSPSMAKRSRFDAYNKCFDRRHNDASLNEWFLWEKLAAVEQGRERTGYEVVKRAVLGCLPDGRELRFDVDRKELVVQLGDQSVPYSCLSDGQRAMTRLVADIAILTVILNPDLGLDSARETPGVVLIDELDLHLHPKWQRRVVEDLRRTFPKIQFFATTHSPFIVQTLRPGELVMLDGQPVPELSNLSIEEIARGLMGVERSDASPRYQEMKQAAKDFLLTLEAADKTPDEKLAAFREALSQKIAPYADNPAFQAFLELKREAKLANRSTPSGTEA